MGRPLRDELLAAGLSELRAVGARRLSLRSVTGKVGVTPMAAYRHFANREALLAALATKAMRDFGRQLLRASRAPDPRKALLATCVAYLRFSRQRAAEFELLFGSDIADRRRYPELYAAGDEAFSALLGVVERCQAAGVLDARRDRLACAASLWVHIHGLCSLSKHWPTSGHIRTPRSDATLVADFIGRLLDGLRGDGT